MSSEATFKLYLYLLGGILVVASVILFVICRAFKKDLGSVWVTYRSWLIMSPILLGAIWLGRSAVIGLVTFISILAFKEFSRATGLYRNWWQSGITYLAILAVGLICWIKDPASTAEQVVSGWYGLFAVLPAYVITVLAMVPVFRNVARGQLQAVALSILGFVYCGWMLGHLSFMANSEHATAYLLFIFFSVGVCDVVAFTLGKLFGKIPLRSIISPNKTIGGALGTLTVAMVLPWLLYQTFPPSFGTREKILTGLIIGIAGPLGDLSLSALKRDLGLKDWGTLLPGHGGLLDRVDSLIFSAPLFLYMVRYLELYE